MGEEMTARNEGCLKGLYRGESEREREGGQAETEANQIPEDAPQGWRIGCRCLVFTHLLSVLLSACYR